MCQEIENEFYNVEEYDDQIHYILLLNIVFNQKHQNRCQVVKYNEQHDYSCYQELNMLKSSGLILQSFHISGINSHNLIVIFQLLIPLILIDFL